MTAALAFSACSAATDQKTETSAAAGTNACTDAVAPDVEAATADIPLALPTEPVDATSLKGKKVFYIVITLNDFVSSVLEGVEPAAKAAGLDLTVWDGQGKVNRVNEGIETAIAQKAGAIALNGIDTTLVPQALAEAKKAGIPIVATFAGDATDPLPDQFFSNISADFTKDGENMAKWIMVNSGCKANTLLVDSSTIAVWGNEVKGAKSAFAECDECTSSDINLDSANFATDTPAQVQSALQRDPGINYVFMPWDSGVPYISSIVSTKGKTQIVGRDGLPASLELIKKGGPQTMTVAMPPGAWIGYATTDDMIRGMLGVPRSGLVIPSRLIDSQNIGDGTTESIFPKYVDFGKSFTDLWGVS